MGGDVVRVRRGLVILLALFMQLGAAGMASASTTGSIELRRQLCQASAPSGFPASAAMLARLKFDCAASPAVSSGVEYRDGWVWLRLRDARVLRALPPNWQLLVDQARFEQIAVIAVARDGTSQRILLGSHGIGRNWAPGGMMRFTVAAAGADIDHLYLGFDRLDGLSLMRKVAALSPAAAGDVGAHWLVLIGLFVGALLSAFVYNLLIYTEQRHAFQRWYLVWVSTALAYGVTWTNLLGFAYPDLVGPTAVRLEFALVGMMIGSGNMFFLAVIEQGHLPRWLRRGGTTLSAAGVMLGIACACDGLFPPIATDRLLNFAIFGSAVSVFLGICYALKGGSRVVWFYMLGWTPVIIVFGLRLARNLGLAGQDDRVDMATFAALAWEAVALSLAIADRFRLLRQERDLAAQAIKLVEHEHETLRRVAHTDALTGLGNRAAFQVTLRDMAEAAEGDAKILFLIDVDHLKGINDRLGHDGGDALLAHVGTLMTAIAGSDGRAARIGGDEFALLLSDAQCTAAVAALDAAQGLSWTHLGRACPISFSIGSARFPADARDITALYKNADLALYRAKALGRGRCHPYDPGLRAQLERKDALVRDAYAGLPRNEFVLHYQPIVDIATTACTGVEALLRWQHPVEGLLTPATFGDLLMEVGIGPMLQERVLTLAIDELRRHGPAAPPLSVNFTAAQLNGKHSAYRLLDRLARADVAPRQLCVEVVEGVVLERSGDDVIAALEILHGAGVSIALDDFGTGYASLVHLRQMPVDALKIDRSFILGLLDGDGKNDEIVRAMILLGKGLGKTVIAEGVETEEQKLRLQSLGCDIGQGYLFGRPGPDFAAGSASGPRPKLAIVA